MGWDAISGCRFRSTQIENSNRRPGSAEPGIRGKILVDLGDFGQIPGPSSVFVILEGAAGDVAAAFLCHYYLLRT